MVGESLETPPEGFTTGGGVSKDSTRGARISDTLACLLRERRVTLMRLIAWWIGSLVLHALHDSPRRGDPAQYATSAAATLVVIQQR